MRALSHGYVTGQLINFFTDDGNLGMVFSVSSCFFLNWVYIVRFLQGNSVRMSVDTMLVLIPLVKVSSLGPKLSSLLSFKISVSLELSTIPRKCKVSVG